ncbi:hypothetical protein LINPERHAP1_LOCUS12996 [Linum perenne]
MDSLSSLLQLPGLKCTQKRLQSTSNGATSDPRATITQLVQKGSKCMQTRTD